MESVLEQLGARGELHLKGPTQMHRLLELVKAEQNVYNVLFFEIIRQVSWDDGFLLFVSFKRALFKEPVTEKYLSKCLKNVSMP